MSMSVIYALQAFKEYLTYFNYYTYYIIYYKYHNVLGDRHEVYCRKNLESSRYESIRFSIN